MKRNKRIKEKGITLVALVITIIILLILAGIAIASLTGDNGLFARADQARQNTLDAQNKENETLEGYENSIDKVLGEEIQQVTDQNPGVLEIDGDNLVINSIEDLVFLAFDVTNGNNYEDKTVKLGLSLDFNSDKSYVKPYRTDYENYGYDGELKTLLTSGEGFKPIGITTSDDKTKNWLGTFDGNNNSIYNLYINITDSVSTVKKIGLFSNNFGSINNLSLKNVNLYLNTDNGKLAGIAGQNSLTGNITKCNVSGTIKQESNKGMSGGIASYSSGNIYNSSNTASIVLNTYDEESAGVGGICGSSGISSIISGCINSGNISGENNSYYMYIGGIAGTKDSDSNEIGKITDCYNSGKISGRAKRLSIGGIVGYTFMTVENSYNIGEISGEATENLYIGKVIGRKYNSSITINNCYYIKTNEITGIGNDSDIQDMSRTEEFMKTTEFVDLLNRGISGAWKEDINNINNGYPILNWQ